MRQTAYAILAALAVFSGCGGIKPGRTPEATYEAIRAAFSEEKYEEIWGILSARARDSQVAEIRKLQQAVEANINNMSADQKELFLRENGASPESFVSMSPSGVFGLQLRNTARLAAGMREAIGSAELGKVEVSGDRAALELTVGEEAAALGMVREHGLWRVESFTDLLDAFRPFERSRRAGRTPQETYEAALACITDGVYEELWHLFSSGLKQRLSNTVAEAKAQLEQMSATERRAFERQFGISADDYMRLTAEDAFRAEIRNVDPRQLQFMAGSYQDAEIMGDRAILRLRGPRGLIQIQMTREDGRWYFDVF